MTDTIEQTIVGSPLFKHLDSRWHDRLVAAGELRRYQAGEVLIAEQAPADSLFVVVSGQVRVWTEADGRDVDLKTLGAGAYFGEVSLLSGKDATATVQAMSDEVAAVALAPDVLLDLVDEDAKIRRMLEGVTLARAKDTIGKVLD